MKNKFFKLLSLIIFINTVWSQNKNLQFKNSIKIYNYSTYEREITLLSNSSKDINSSFKVLKPTISFMRKSKKNNFHEIELNNFVLNKDDSKSEFNNTTNNSYVITGQKLITTSISARYEYILNFNKKKDFKLVPSIGFGLNPYYNKLSLKPKTSSSFESSKIKFGFKTFITPRLTYFVSSKLFVDFNIPICIFDMYTNEEKLKNPNLPEHLRTSSNFNFNLFPLFYSLRLGLGVKI